MDVWEIHGSRERSIPPRLVRTLYDDAGWWPARTEADIAAVLVTNSAVGAWVGADLVGFARLVADGRLRAFIEDVVVHHAYRRRGIATAMLQRLLNEVGQLEVVSLFCEPGLVPCTSTSASSRPARLSCTALSNPRTDGPGAACTVRRHGKGAFSPITARRGGREPRWHQQRGGTISVTETR